jgi:hypothetical protein
MVYKLREIIKKLYMPVLIGVAAATISGCSKEVKQQEVVAKAAQQEVALKQDITLEQILGAYEKATHNLQLYVKRIDKLLDYAKKEAILNDSLEMDRRIEFAKSIANEGKMDITEKVNQIYNIYVDARLSWAEGLAKDGNRAPLKGLLESANEYGVKINRDVSAEEKRIMGIIDSNPEKELEFLKTETRGWYESALRWAQDADSDFMLLVRDIRKVEAQIESLNKIIAEKKI